MTQRYFGKRGELRIYSGETSVNCAGSLAFFKVGFVNMNFTAPEGRPRPEEIPVLDRGLIDANAHHVQGLDDVIMAPQNITFTADLDDTVNRDDLRAALSNPDRNSPWTVGGVSFAANNGTSQLRNGFGSLVSTPSPFDSEHERVTLEVIWTGGTPGSNDTGRKYSEVWFSPDQVQLTESENNVQLAATGFWYGPVSHISAFSPGTEV